MLGKLKKVELREAWKHEALDFTRWLAQEENLSLLSDEVGIGIRALETEAKVGKFSVDILAEEDNTGRKIIIENQLESTDHDHLGKLITYASGHDATIIIWIVKDVRDEHRRAIDWLNEHTDEELNFFAIKLELWQIEDSRFAPKFHVIASPNEWAKSVKRWTRGELTETNIMQLEFWNRFKEYSQKNKSELRLTTVGPRPWYNIILGSPEAHIVLTLNIQANLISCEVYISDSKELFANLVQYKDKIEEELGTKLEWMALENKKVSKVKLSKKGNLKDTNKWNEHFEWLMEQAENFQKVFGKYIKEN